MINTTIYGYRIEQNLYGNDHKSYSWWFPDIALFSSGRPGYPPVAPGNLGDIKPHELIPYIKSTLQQRCTLDITIKHIPSNARATGIPLELFLQQPNIVAKHQFAISTMIDSQNAGKTAPDTFTYAQLLLLDE